MRRVFPWRRDRRHPATTLAAADDAARLLSGEGLRTRRVAIAITSGRCRIKYPQLPRLHAVDHLRPATRARSDAHDTIDAIAFRRIFTLAFHQLQIGSDRRCPFDDLRLWRRYRGRSRQTGPRGPAYLFCHANTACREHAASHGNKQCDCLDCSGAHAPPRGHIVIVPTLACKCKAMQPARQMP